MSKYNSLSDSPNEKIVLLGLLNGKHEIEVDIKTHVSKIINSKSNAAGEPFKTMGLFTTVSPTVVNLLNNKGKDCLENKIQEDVQNSIIDLCKIVSGKEDKISQAFLLISLDPSYMPGNLYRVELTLQYR